MLTDDLIGSSLCIAEEKRGQQSLGLMFVSDCLSTLVRRTVAVYTILAFRPNNACDACVPYESSHGRSRVPQPSRSALESVSASTMSWTILLPINTLESRAVVESGCCTRIEKPRRTPAAFVLDDYNIGSRKKVGTNSTVTSHHRISYDYDY